jgi:hypothetical protein
MPPARAVVDLPQDVLSRAAHSLAHVGMGCLRDQVIAAIFDFEGDVVADAAISIVDAYLRVDVVNTA